LLLAVLMFLFFFDNIHLTVSFTTLHNTQWQKTVLGIVAMLPLLLVLFSKFWQAMPLQRKLLLLTLAAFVISHLYSNRYVINYRYVFLAGAVICFAFERKFYRPNLVFVLLVVYFLWNALSYFWTADSHEYFMVMRRYLPFMLLPFAFCLFSLTKDERDWMLLILFRTALVWMFLSLCCWILESRLLGVPLSDWFVEQKTFVNQSIPSTFIFAWSNFMHPTYTSLLYLSALAFGALLRQMRSRFHPSLLEILLFFAASGVLVLITQSRTGVVSWAVLAVVFYLSLFWKKKKILWVNVLLLCLLFGLTKILYGDYFAAMSLDEVRQQLYETAFYSIKSNYLTGTGVGGMKQIIDSPEIASLLGYPFPRTGCYSPHNQFVGDLMQTGIIGLLLLLTLCGTLLYRSLKDKNRFLLIFLLLVFLVMLIEMPLLVKKGAAIFVLLVCLLMGKTEKNSKNSQVMVKNKC